MLPSSVILLVIVGFSTATRVEYSVECSNSAMDIWVWGTGLLDVQLDKWGIIKGCESEGYLAKHINLPFHGPHCGLTKVKNTLTKETIYYHRIGVTTLDGHKIILVKCLAKDNSTLSNIVKRNVLPPEFVEPDYIEITSEVSGTAPVPILGVGVRQNGALVDGQINVTPGDPLSMEVYLDDDSASIYGILVSYMEVTDTNDKQETILFNGCSLDSYLFENFETDSGDYLAAKFRAFKFPESSFVLFQGTVDVCINKCQGIQCSNGQVGFGRKRRSVTTGDKDPNKIFEVSMETFIKFEETVKTETNIPVNSKTGLQQNPSLKNMFEDFYLGQFEELESRDPISTNYNSGNSLSPPIILITLIIGNILKKITDFCLS